MSDTHPMIQQLLGNNEFLSKLNKKLKIINSPVQVIDEESSVLFCKQIEFPIHQQYEPTFIQPQSRASIVSMTQNPFLTHMNHKRQQKTAIGLGQLVKEVAGLIQMIVKRSFEDLEDNKKMAHNIDTEFIEKITLINQQNYRKLKTQFQQQITNVSIYFQRLIEQKLLKLKQESSVSKTNKRLEKSKNVHRNITQNILQLSSRSRQDLSCFSNIAENILSDSDIQPIVQQSSSMTNPSKNTIQIQKILLLQKNQQRLSANLDQINKLIIHVQQSINQEKTKTEQIIKDFKCKSQERLEGGFAGVWNILTDMEDKINQLNHKISDLEQVFRLRK